MRSAALALLAVAALAGCGGAASPPPAAKPPRIPRALAQSWARQADAVAQEIAAGDGCTARSDATALATAVVASAGRVPARLRSRLQPVVAALPGRIQCNPAPPTPVRQPPSPHPHPHPPGGRHGHGHGHGHGHPRR